MKWLSWLGFSLACAAQIPQMSMRDLENSLDRNLQGDGGACEQRGASTSRGFDLTPLNLECADQLLSAEKGKPHEPLSPVASVSAERLRHKPPKAARKAFERGSYFVKSGDHQKAVAECEKAIQHDPEFADAHSLLGVEYAAVGRYGEAEAELRRTLTLDPGFWNAHYNLALVLLQRGDSVGAEKSARQALDLSRSNPRAHLLLGLLLLSRTETEADGMQHLRQAARTMPIAEQVLEELQTK
jgi:tetratricopeptide (TPR) repeat protein